MVVSVFFSSANASIRLLMIAGARPLVGSSISTSFLGSTMAREMDSICFWPPESRPAGSCQNCFMGGKKRKIQSSLFSSGGPLRAASTRFSRTVRPAKMPMDSGT
ncbi:hypothetical protein D3C83_34400 [compost metagenome]